MALFLLLSACGSSTTNSSSSADADEGLRPLTFPDGFVIKTEIKITPQQQQIGMMYRTSLPHNRGMLFVYQQPQAIPYWMENCNFPLDIIFIGANHKVVEIVDNAPPCRTAPCPTLGGTRPALFVLEINGGDAAKHGIKIDSQLAF